MMSWTISINLMLSDYAYPNLNGPDKKANTPCKYHSPAQGLLTP